MLNKRLLSVSILFAVIWAGFCSLWAKAANLNDDLRSKYGGKVLMLWNSYCGSDLKFNAQGELLAGGRAGSWTICRDIRIGDVRIEDHKKGRLIITGQRLYLVHGSGEMNFRDVTEDEPDANKKTKAYKDLLHSQQVSMEVQLPLNPDDAQIQLAMDKVFYTSEQEFFEALPDLWKCFFHTELHNANCEESKPGESVTPETGAIERVGKRVKAPREIHTPDPSYTDEARMAKYQGTTVLTIVVDSTGDVKRIRVARPLGLGLDEQAAARISTWKFTPAEREGKPVAVQVNVEVTFNLY